MSKKKFWQVKAKLRKKINKQVDFNAQKQIYIYTAHFRVKGSEPSFANKFCQHKAKY